MKTDLGPAVRTAALVLVVVGGVLRFYGLDAKLFWHDEIYTGLAIAGSSHAEISKTLFDGRDHARQEILAHQFPRANKNAIHTICAMAEYQPRHPPLYFVLARAWTLLWGPSVTSLRAFSAFLGLLSLPLLFLLSRELHKDALFQWIAISLVAISPLHLVYGQEARQYMLWLDLLLLASWILLIGIRCSKAHAWRSRAFFGLYAVLLVMSLYTHLLSLLILAAHTLFVLATERTKRVPVVRRFGMAVLVALVLFFPWACLLMQDFQQQRPWVGWAAQSISLQHWVLRVAAAWSRPFLDLEEGWVVLGAIPLGVVAGSVVWMLSRAPRRIKWFLISLGTWGALPFVTADLFLGGWRTGVIRFQFPAVLAMQLSLAFVLSYGLRSPSLIWRRLAITLTLLFVVSESISSVTYLRAPMWWNKATVREIYDDARQLNQCPAPLLISSEHGHRSLGDLMALVQLLDKDVTLRLVVEPIEPQLPVPTDDAYLWGISETMLGNLIAKGWELEPVGDYQLYRFVRFERPPRG